MPRGMAHGSAGSGAARRKDTALCPYTPASAAFEQGCSHVSGARPTLLSTGEPRPSLLLPPFPCGHHTGDAQPWLQAGSLCLDTRASMSLTCALVSPGNGCPAMPCHARLEQHPVCRGRALSCLCRAAAVQVAGLSCAAAGCELPAKRAAGISSRAALPRAGAGTAGPSHTSCRRAGMG